MYELYALDYKGIIHIGSTDSISRYEMAKMIAKKAGLNEKLVTAQQTLNPAKTPRHKNGILSIKKAESILKETKILTVEQTVQRAVNII